MKDSNKIEMGVDEILTGVFGMVGDLVERDCMQPFALVFSKDGERVGATPIAPPPVPFWRELLRAMVTDEVEAREDAFAAVVVCESFLMLADTAPSTQMVQMLAKGDLLLQDLDVPERKDVVFVHLDHVHLLNGPRVYIGARDGETVRDWKPLTDFLPPGEEGEVGGDAAGALLSDAVRVRWAVRHG